ncbi:MULTISPECIES: phosphogluconate dehydrogenase (NAD(+)-dependent, decarboxylating) [Faecalicoccus]|uniref:Decarboxylating 6-phosphogluconate dehydrogenase n=1 Tax=Faecalicoccus pleomorphus TaxID=1323 RepID=A0AAW6CRD0_9FIRM|nr:MULTISPECIES: decarboxylating 6-phosphogluconate dehydrogenase [Faecalicoccus]MDB7982908.1 decarboxylating 6-phosphogluconate dehydrogenase [Faecalicoccus pleomorphus]MDB7983913.1 decarboxylating 6-phosphogluconate dehydrogenase [Faecalicoccus pleomorphus]MDB7993839.1 decarboxylating 6-phosphogluconate dehydrogenase [Faecalicoccus pleomorphus]MDY5110428.1 decarboxylating 6-phosphogluconate dehydrogenase [Faecalicoccus sp.]
MEALTLKIGVIGLGKMGVNIAMNLQSHGYGVVGFDTSVSARNFSKNQGIEVKENIRELLSALDDRKVVWLMLPSGETIDDCINQLTPYLMKDDILIDGGNSYYKDSVSRAKSLKQKEIFYLDVGTSGGMKGARTGACLMIGGDKRAYEYLKGVFEDISVTDGQLYTGSSGSGHYMKMIHNAIEYGMMESIGEGFQLLKESEYNYDLKLVAKNWNNGSVIRGWLMELAQEQFNTHPGLKDVKGVVDATGEAKWAVEEALSLGISIPIIALSLMVRNNSKDEEKFSCKVVSALRNGFGGHTVIKEKLYE